MKDFYETADGYSTGGLGGRRRSVGQFDALLGSLAPRIPRWPAELLDFGCGNGDFLRQAIRRGWKAIGYEPTEHLAEIARSGGTIPIHSESDLDAVAIKADSLDVISSAHVIEHLPDPMRVVRWMHGKLKPGGLLSLQVPNQFDDLLWRWLRRRWMQKGKPLGYHLHHLNFFSLRSIRRLVSDAGFDILESSSRYHLRNRRELATGGIPLAKALRILVYGMAGLGGAGPNLDVIAIKRSV